MTNTGTQDTGPSGPGGTGRALGTWPKLAISVLALAALVFLVLSDVDAGVGFVALVVLAILPWLSTVLEAVDLLGVVSLRFRQVEKKVKEQEKQLNAQNEIIAQLVVYSVAWYIFELLSQLYHRAREGGEYLYRDNEAMKRDLRFLRDHGYLEHFTISELRDGQDLVTTLTLTPVGNFLVELRERPASGSVRESPRVGSGAGVRETRT